MAYDFVSGDTARKLTLPLRDAAGNVIPLTGMTVELHWRNQAGHFIERAMEVIDAAGGVAEYELGPGELEPGVMVFEWQVTDPSGNTIRSTSLFPRVVREKVG